MTLEQLEVTIELITQLHETASNPVLARWYSNQHSELMVEWYRTFSDDTEN